MPDPPLTPPDTQFDPEVPPSVQAWHTRSGHVLVLPKIDGKEIGYMMLDTGTDASCMLWTPSMTVRFGVQLCMPGLVCAQSLAAQNMMFLSGSYICIYRQQDCRTRLAVCRPCSACLQEPATNLFPTLKTLLHAATEAKPNALSPSSPRCVFPSTKPFCQPPSPPLPPQHPTLLAPSKSTPHPLSSCCRPCIRCPQVHAAQLLTWHPTVSHLGTAWPPVVLALLGLLPTAQVCHPDAVLLQVQVV